MNVRFAYAIAVARRWACGAAVLSATMLMINSPAFGGLGEDVSSVQADRAHLQGSFEPRKAKPLRCTRSWLPLGLSYGNTFRHRARSSL